MVRGGHAAVKATGAAAVRVIAFATAANRSWGIWRPTDHLPRPPDNLGLF
jgi:hypothetical protein